MEVAAEPGVKTQNGEKMKNIEEVVDYQPWIEDLKYAFNVSETFRKDIIKFSEKMEKNFKGRVFNNFVKNTLIKIKNILNKLENKILDASENEKLCKIFQIFYEAYIEAYCRYGFIDSCVESSFITKNLSKRIEKLIENKKIKLVEILEILDLLTIESNQLKFIKLILSKSQDYKCYRDILKDIHKRKNELKEIIEIAEIMDFPKEMVPITLKMIYDNKNYFESLVTQYENRKKLAKEKLLTYSLSYDKEELDEIIELYYYLKKYQEELPLHHEVWIDPTITKIENTFFDSLAKFLENNDIKIEDIKEIDTITLLDATKKLCEGKLDKEEFIKIIKKYSYEHRHEHKHINRIKKSRILKGIGVSAGYVKGTCLIVDSEDLEEWKNALEKVKNLKSPILVTSMTSPEYTPLFAYVKGIITEYGGYLSHAAIVARELRLPCISSVNHATTILNTGTEVEMEGTQGIIKVIKFSNTRRLEPG